MSNSKTKKKQNGRFAKRKKSKRARTKQEKQEKEVNDITLCKETVKEVRRLLEDLMREKEMLIKSDEDLALQFRNLEEIVEQVENKIKRAEKEQKRSNVIVKKKVRRKKKVVPKFKHVKKKKGNKMSCKKTTKLT